MIIYGFGVLVKRFKGVFCFINKVRGLISVFFIM